MILKGKKERKIIQHRFLDRWTIPGVILLVLGGFVAGQLIGSLVGAIFGIIQGILTAVAERTGTSTSETTKELFTIGTELGSVFAAFLLLAVYWRWFWPEYRGSLPLENKSYWLRFAGIAVVVVFVIQMASFLIEKTEIGFPHFASLCAALMAGCFEEAVYRGIGCSYLMRQWPDEKGILRTMLITSVIFALVHAVNLLAGAPLGITIVQIVNAMGLGMFLCAVFLRSGSLWPGIIIHTFFDAIAFMDTSSLTTNGTFKSDVTVSSAMDLVGFAFIIAAVAVALYMIRPSVRGEIVETWKKKWNPVSA